MHILESYLPVRKFLKFAGSNGSIRRGYTAVMWREMCLDLLFTSMLNQDPKYTMLTSLDDNQTDVSPHKLTSEWRALFHRHAPAATVMREHVHYTSLDLQEDVRAVTALDTYMKTSARLAQNNRAIQVARVESDRVNKVQNRAATAISRLPDVLLALAKHKPNNPKSVANLTKRVKRFWFTLACRRCSKPLTAEAGVVEFSRCGHLHCAECYADWCMPNQRCSGCSFHPEVLPTHDSIRRLIAGPLKQVYSYQQLHLCPRTVLL